MNAIFKREFKSYFTNPIGYIVLAVFYFFLGLNFFAFYISGIPDLEYLMPQMILVVVFAMPILTMRLMSEDRRQKVDQALLTAPVNLFSIVMGKFLAAFAIFALAFAPMFLFELLVVAKVTVNFLSFLYSLLGMMLLGGAIIAIGMFISSLTESTVISAILTFLVNVLVLYMSSFASMISVEWIANIFNKLAFISVFEGFSSKIFSITDVVYFLSIIAVFLFLCVRSLEKRRWS